jgi:hypothetical protein
MKLLGGGSLFAVLGSRSHASSNSLKIDELYSSLEVWRKTEEIEPEHYLDLNCNENDSLNSLIVEEFKASKVLKVNGLVLSKIEVAFLAAVAKKKLKV